MANVLVVDDHAETLELVIELLQLAGHLVRSGSNGEEGLESMDTLPLPDCVVLDVDMPVLSGPDMMRRMVMADTGKEDIPIVLVSGRSDLAAIANGVGTPYFLCKSAPDFGSDLRRVVDRALREHRAPAAA